MLRKLLVGLDGSKGSFRALEEAMHLASLAGTELHTISVEEVPRFPGTVGEMIQDKEAANRRFAAAIVRARTMAEEQGLKLAASRPRRP